MISNTNIFEPRPLTSLPTDVGPIAPVGAKCLNTNSSIDYISSADNSNKNSLLVLALSLLWFSTNYELEEHKTKTDISLQEK